MSRQHRQISAILTVHLILVAGGAAQDAPYAGMETRPIKALSADEIAGYLAGDGMGFALAAELNGLPGPKHVIELADSLGLTATQRAAVQARYETMLLEARRLGTALVRAERELDSAFTGGTIDAQALQAATRAIALLKGQLRYTHLVAHLDMRGVLTAEQTERYARLRGYAGAQGSRHQHDSSHRRSQSS